jgi:dihydrofolate reductase
MTIGSIAAVSPEWVIGLDNDIPWHHPGDFRRFKRVTMGGVIIMGRRTWESMDRRPLPGRRNLLVTRSPDPAIESFGSVGAALEAARKDGVDVWFVGGAGIYEAAMPLVDLIDITFVPDRVTAEGAVRFPSIDPQRFDAGPIVPHEDEPGLTRRIYTRREPHL